MLLDSYTLNNGISTLLSPAPAGFTKRVNASFLKIDALLKTLQVRASPPEALVQAYLIHIADRSEANFRRILELKGLRSKQEQNYLIELFQIRPRKVPKAFYRRPPGNTRDPRLCISNASHAMLRHAQDG